jgi:hypothetical protein
MCLSDREVAVLRKYVEDGGTLVVDGRAGLLAGEGRVREARALDELLGVKGAAGVAGMREAPVSQDVDLEGQIAGPAATVPVKTGKFSTLLLEPKLQVTTGQTLATGGAPAVVVNRVGKGCAITVNLPWSDLNGERSQARPQPRAALLAAILQAAGVAPFCELRDPAGQQPLVIQQVAYREGPARYLALFHDLLMSDLGPQPVHVRLPEAAVVYDMRAGKRLGSGKISEWDAVLSRGWPLVYSLLPYEVTGLAASAPGAATRGTVAPVSVQVQTRGGAPGWHVVRLNVYPPGATEPHRQYSQNLACPAGAGQGNIPLALNDPVGTWQLELRDVATGVTVRRALVVK